MFSIWVVKVALVAGFLTLQSKVRHKTDDKRCRALVSVTYVYKVAVNASIIGQMVLKNS